MELTTSISQKNYRSFLWHATFLAIASAFMDVDTIIPSMLINAGGTSVHVGILTAILIGGTRLSQLFFAPYINSKPNKKGLLIMGIYLRVLALIGVAVVFYFNTIFSGWLVIALIFVFMTSFSLGGAFATVSYTDILGKSILQDLRKSFFSMRQIISSSGTLLSAWLAGYVLKNFQYPSNYFAVFAIAAIFLSIASLGFWRVNETKVEKGIESTGFWKSIFHELKTNKRLTWYLLLTNTLGLNYAILPFVLLLGKSNAGMSDGFVSNLLLTKMSGLILAGIFIFFFSKKIKYDTILKISLGLGLAFPLIAWIYQDHLMAYYIAFFIGGLYGSLFVVSSNGILLEISSANNRSIYAGISGAGNILPTLIPLMAGLLIATAGFSAFFISVLIITLSSAVFIYRLNCLK
jgi:MFS family permease